MSISLYNIESALQALVEEREIAESEGDAEAVKVIDLLLTEWAQREVKKVDGVAEAIRAYRLAGEVERAESQRHAERAQRFEATVERIKAHALQAMKVHCVTKLETPNNTLTVCGNGGLQPLQVDELELDWEWFNITVTMPCSMWQTLTVGGLPSIDKTAKLSPDTERIREALKQRVVCPKCHGTSTHVEIKDPCPRCGGAGTIPQTIPGARLYPRGEHLRVK